MTTRQRHFRRVIMERGQKSQSRVKHQHISVPL